MLTVFGLVVLSCALCSSSGDGLPPVPTSEAALVYGGSGCLNYQNAAMGCGLNKCPYNGWLYTDVGPGGSVVVQAYCNNAKPACGQIMNVYTCTGSGYAGPQ